MSIRPTSGAAYNRAENLQRRSSASEPSKSAFDEPLAGNNQNRQMGAKDQGTGQGGGGMGNSLPKFESLADVLVKFDAANSANAKSNEQLQTTLQGFENKFASVAGDPEAFEALMQTAFGDKYDKQAAETIRQQTLAGDFSWMPEIKVVEGSTLADTSGMQAGAEGLGAYDSASDTIYLSEELLAGDPDKAVEILTEEVGHAIDTRVNTSDSAGDEGELFAKLVNGEQLSDAQIQAARAENDHGTIVVDGKTVEVEYGVLSSIGRAISSGVQAVGNAISSGAEAVGNAISSGAEAVGNVISGGAEIVSKGIKAIGGAVSDGASKVGNILSDSVNFIGDKLTDGLDFVNDKVVSPLLNTIPVVGPWLNDHIVQPGFGLLDTTVNFSTNVVDSFIDFNTQGLTGMIDTATNLAAGDLSGAWDSAVGTVKTLGKDIVGFAIESFLIPVKGIAGAINDMFNLAETRGLRPEEQAYLETIYGDSLDYDEIQIQVGGGIEGKLGVPAHAIGNNIYMGKDSFEADGSLKPDGLDLLAHEAGHVWQFQTDGAGYIGDAVISYGESIIEQGDRNGAYDFTTAIEQMKPWDDMTPDEQAEIAMVIGEAYELGGGVLTEDSLEAAIDHHNGKGRGKLELSGDQIQYIKDIHEILKAG